MIAVARQSRPGSLYTNQHIAKLDAREALRLRALGLRIPLFLVRHAWHLDYCMSASGEVPRPPASP